MLGVRIKRPSSSKNIDGKCGFYEKLIDSVFKPMTLGRLTISLPDGRRLYYGQGDGNVEASIRVLNNAFFKKCVLFGDVGFGESFVDGDWETGDIAKVIEWMIRNVENHPTLMLDGPRRSRVNFLKILNTMVSVWRRNTIVSSAA